MFPPRPGRTILQLPARLAAEHASRYPNGVVWHDWERADTKLSESARKDRFWVREYRDAYRKAFGLLGNPALFEECSTAVEEIVAIVRRRRPTLSIGLAADAVAAKILAAIRRDPDGAPDYTDQLERLADALTERADTQFCVPHVLTVLGALFAKDGEPQAAMELLDETINVLDAALSTGTNPILVTRNLALAFCAKSELHHAAGEPEARLFAAKEAWQRVQLAEPMYHYFVLARYCHVLEDQHHPPAVIEQVRKLVRQKMDEAGTITDWLLKYWPEVL